MEIRDEKLKPYFIRVTSDSYDVCKDVNGKDKETGGEKPYTTTIGYYKDFANCIKAIIRERMVSNGEVIPLEEFLQKYSNLLDEMNEVLSKYK